MSSTRDEVLELADGSRISPHRTQSADAMAMASRTTSGESLSNTSDTQTSRGQMRILSPRASRSPRSPRGSRSPRTRSPARIPLKIASQNLHSQRSEDGPAAQRTSNSPRRTRPPSPQPLYRADCSPRRGLSPRRASLVSMGDGSCVRIRSNNSVIIGGAASKRIGVTSPRGVSPGSSSNSKSPHRVGNSRSPQRGRGVAARRKAGKVPPLTHTKIQSCYSDEDDGCGMRTENYGMKLSSNIDDVDDMRMCADDGLPVGPQLTRRRVPSAQSKDDHHPLGPRHRSFDDSEEIGDNESDSTFVARARRRSAAMQAARHRSSEGRELGRCCSVPVSHLLTPNFSSSLLSRGGGTLSRLMSHESVTSCASAELHTEEALENSPPVGSKSRSILFSNSQSLDGFDKMLMLFCLLLVAVTSIGILFINPISPRQPVDEMGL